MLIKENEPLRNYSTFKIGGLARYFVVAKSKEEILEAMNFAKEKSLPYFVFGGGSNILFRDEGYKGVAIKNQNSKIKIQNDNSKFKIVEIGAGNLLSQAISFSIENGLTGLEWGVGIPGTIGGCVAGNCGAYGHSISELVGKVKTLEKEYLNKECGFVYRGSKFKNSDNKEAILEIELNLKKGEVEKSREKIKNILADRKGKIPQYPSVGCIFKNFKSQNSNLKHISARSLIEQCGLAGRREGDAQISELQPNFIVNLGSATSKDVLSLVKLCKEKVKEKFNLDSEEEIVII